MQNTTQFSAIPPRPEGLVNPVEAPIAAAVVKEMPLGILFQEQKVPLYYWLVKRFPNLAEELWVELFAADLEPTECRVLQFQAC